jgi:phytoene synthase
VTAALARPPGEGSATRICAATLARHSRSFALAARLLPPAARDDAAVVYTWCRRVDDAVDEAPSQLDAARALARAREELERSVYGGAATRDVALAAFAEVVDRHAIPRRYPEELLAGMEMDVRGVRYESLADLLRYCYRVAGTVGLMMSHVMGVSDRRALRHAAHLGIAMQLTNVCRDVEEDWRRGRLYVPRDLLDAAGAADPPDGPGAPLPRALVPALARGMRALLALADRYYASGDQGLAALDWRCALAVRTARLDYADIGRVISARGHDPLAGREVVRRRRKLALVAQASALAALEWPVRARRRFAPVALQEVVGDDVVRL